jgi:hypothetical protein
MFDMATVKVTNVSDDKVINNKNNKKKIISTNKNNVNGEGTHW